MSVQNILILVGVGLVVLGLAWPLLDKVGLGRLPGDIVYERENIRFYFPVVSCLIVSVLLSLLFWFLRR